MTGILPLVTISSKALTNEAVFPSLYLVVCCHTHQMIHLSAEVIPLVFFVQPNWYFSTLSVFACLRGHSGQIPILYKQKIINMENLSA